jgi:hypothetical protein
MTAAGAGATASVEEPMTVPVEKDAERDEVVIWPT